MPDVQVTARRGLACTGPPAWSCSAQPPQQGVVIDHSEDEAVIVEDEAVLDDVPPGQPDRDEALVQRYPYLNVKVHTSGCCHRMLPPATWSLCVLQ